MAEAAVTVAYVHQNEVTYSWHHSMVEMVGYDLSNSGRIMAGGYIAMRCGSDGLVEARNKAVRHFLEDKPADWFFWIDTDMGFAPDTVDRLLEAADPVERPIVAALCFSMRETHSDELGGWRTAPTPTIFDWAHLKKVKDGELTEEMGFAVRWDYPLDTLVRCTGTGSACILIHRSVFERIEAEHGPIWYNKVPNTSTGQIVSEDLSFCLRAGALNIPVHVHTGVRTTHMKPVWVAEEDYWAHRAVTPAPGTVDEHNRKFELPVYVDLAASSAALAANEHDRDDMLKFPADLDRYRSIIDATRPDVVVETGTRTGGSARWFADLGVDVVTVDVNEVFIPAAYTDRVTQVVGDSTDPTVVEQVQKLVAGRRAMVSLDSDHSGPHVSKEIAAYGPMVTPGCYLVVEDAIFGYAEPPLRAQHGLAGMAGSPLDSIVDLLVDNPDWSRDVAVERAFPVSSNPAGWWRRNE